MYSRTGCVELFVHGTDMTPRQREEGKTQNRHSQNPFCLSSIETIGLDTTFETLAPRLSVAGAGCSSFSQSVSKTLVFDTGCSFTLVYWAER